MRNYQRQTGAVLVVGLLLLLVITLVSVASMQRSVLQERMTANLYERQLAVQQVEAALRSAENWIAAQLPDPRDSIAGNDWFYNLPMPGAADRWTSAATQWRAAPVINTDMANAAQYFIEYLGEWPSPINPDCASATTIEPDCLSPTFRITARNISAAGEPGVQMQTIWRL
ncbi:PilX N-terminal domain-containing pilus assembly protein [Rheinheimera sp. MMS21-TC3]|uniref:pilus assembly PilX family protein n=1 Tax=Rheinheimera sp. MMS21-TC3 TaxID=3072790 RepID=UPI0028C451B4|nr:PilX N-terminal domain-containing pilus assembly protein [Rheinheimera sp. MMS21-TC3]WNO59996.1 PilX N-terminal domain-containing pilus assembly protein [Rheinheimera sp. MMS21-TC3]